MTALNSPSSSSPAPDASDRRQPRERRGKDRRKPGGRINKQAPRRSLMKVIGAYATLWSFGILSVLFSASEVAGLRVPTPAAAFFVALSMFSCLVLMLGSLEQRMIEIRLELMMTNGGMRRADRRGGDRRAGDGASERREAAPPPDGE